MFKSEIYAGLVESSINIMASDDTEKANDMFCLDLQFSCNTRQFSVGMVTTEKPCGHLVSVLGTQLHFMLFSLTCDYTGY